MSLLEGVAVITKCPPFPYGRLSALAAKEHGSRAHGLPPLTGRQLQRQQMSAMLKVLLIDSAERDLTEVPGLLMEAGLVVKTQAANNPPALQDALESQSWDVAVCAYGATGFGSLSALEMLRSQAPCLPVVVVSGVGGADAAVTAMKAGAVDYVMRGDLVQLVPALRQAASRACSDAANLLQEAGKASRQLRKSQAVLTAAQRMGRMAHVITGPDGLYEYSDSLLELLGVDAAHAPSNVGDWQNIVHPDDIGSFRKVVGLASETGAPQTLAYRIRHASGEWRDIRHGIEALEGAGEATRWLCTLQDVTEYKAAAEKIRKLATEAERDGQLRGVAEQEHAALEASLREAQKMESLGMLAGGIAHDFNNLLAAMLGNVSLARMNMSVPQKIGYNLDQVDKAGARARELAKQILAFSRKQPQQFVVQSMRAVVIEALSLMRSTLPAGVDLTVTIPDTQPTYVSVDGGQISQVLLNLCTNAWHATCGVRPRIEVILDEVTLDAHATQRPGDLPANCYVRLQVKDNGHGMDEHTQARIFEPFFTTKPTGQGTGLGLAVVHSIVKAHGGAITVDSAVSGGTTFSVYLPAVAPMDMVPDDLPGAAPTDGQGRHVMYVDDYDAMGELVSEVLRAVGYQVSVHNRGEAALADLRANPDAFDLIITDQNMPGMAGTELARQVRLIRARLPVVISSGYISEDLKAKAGEAGVLEVIDKTRSVEQLAGSIHGWIGAKRN